MPMPRKADPAKSCRACNAALVRKRINGRLEDRGTFLRRVYCDRACLAMGYEGTIKVLNDKNSHRQSAKANRGACEECARLTKTHVHHVDGNGLNNAPSNLKTLCASCHRLAHSQLKRETLQRFKPCSHCSREARHNGLCNTHYSRWRRHGDPLLVKRWNGHGEPAYLRDS